jgi:hypothetical protein
MYLWYSIILLIIANTISWFQLHSQFVWKEVWFWNNPWTTALVGFPVGVMYFYATKFSFLHFGFTWNFRMVGFGVGTIIFGIMSWSMLKEIPTLKTVICILLALAIILIQISNVWDK